jgi:hypothetical protein
MSLLSGLANQTIDTVVSVEKDRFGDDTETTVYTDIECRWQEKTQKLHSASSENVVSKVQIWVYAEYNSIQEGWKITKGSETYTVGIREPRYGLAGDLDHLKLYLV